MWGEVRALPAHSVLAAYVVVAHDREVIEVYERQGDAWILRVAHAGEQAEIDAWTSVCL